MDCAEIHVNIWDDYYGDGFVPEGEQQETYIYVEMRDDKISKEEKKACLEFLLPHIRQFPTESASFSLFHHDTREEYPDLEDNPVYGFRHWTRWEIRVVGMTHAVREGLTEHLAGLGLSFRGVPLNIYSES